MLKKAQICGFTLGNIAADNNNKKEGRLEEVVVENNVLRKEIVTAEYLYVDYQ